MVFEICIAGRPDAQFGLGQMYEEGEGIHQNYKIAAEWYRKACEHRPDYGGAGQGCNALGFLYMDGNGVPKDYLEAYKYFSVAGVPNNANWAAERLTPADLGRAKEAVRVWHLEHPNPQIAANPHVK